MGCAGSRAAPRAAGAQLPPPPLASDARHLRVKLVLLGDSGVGKSCIVMRFVRGSFDADSKVTVGAAFLAQVVASEDGATTKFEIWDTAGQERYASLAPLYYRGASAAAVVYDVTNMESFTKAASWVLELQKHAAPGCVIVLVGNKRDQEEAREVPPEAAQAYAAEHGLACVETSAKTAEGVHELFALIAARLPRGTHAPGAAAGAGGAAAVT